MTAHQHQAVVSGQTAGGGLIVGPAGGGHEHNMRPGPALFRTLALHFPQAVGDGLGIEYHSAAAAIGIVVGLALFVFGVVPDLVAMGLKEIFGPGAAQNAGAEKRVAQLGKERYTINAHSPYASSPFTGSSNIPPMGRMVTVRAARSTPTMNSGTAGIRWSCPAASRTV